jgi:hypothetical protein
VLGYISDPAVKDDVTVCADMDGIVIGRTNIPLVYEGEAVFHIGKTPEMPLLEEQIDTLSNDNILNPPELVEEPVIV